MTCELFSPAAWVSNGRDVVCQESKNLDQKFHG